MIGAQGYNVKASGSIEPDAFDSMLGTSIV